MPQDNSKYYLENQDEDVETMETFTTKIDGNYLQIQVDRIIPFIL